MTKVSLTVIIFAVTQSLLLNGLKAQGPTVEERNSFQANILDVLSTNDSAENRYNAFRDLIYQYHENCRVTALGAVIDGSSLDLNTKAAIKTEIKDLYAKYVRDYPEQSKQAIFDGQVLGPIAENSAIASCALCHQMVLLAMGRVAEAKGK